MINESLNWVAWVVVQKWFSPIISALTIPILAWTAWEALKANRATSNSNNLKLLPLLGMYLTRRSNEDDLFKVKNLGEGVAYGIKIDSWMLIFQDTHEIVEFNMSVTGTNILSKGEDKIISTKVFINGNPATISTGLTLAYLTGFNTEIQIHFKDARGKKYASLIQLSDKQVNIVKPAYRVDLLSGINIWYGLTIQRRFKVWTEKILWNFEERKIGKRPNYLKRVVLIIIIFIKRLIKKVL